jgi:hypothetical protein
MPHSPPNSPDLQDIVTTLLTSMQMLQHHPTDHVRGARTQALQRELVLHLGLAVLQRACEEARP